MIRIRFVLSKTTPDAQLGLQSYEHDPYLQIFLSGQITQQTKTWTLPLPTQPTELTIESPCNKNIDGTYASVGFSLMCRRAILNERGQQLGYSRYAPIGGGMLYLSDVNRRGTFDVPLIDYSFTDATFVRAQLSVNVAEASIGGKLIGAPTAELHAKRQARMNAIFKSFHDMFVRKVKPTIPSYRDKHIKTYYAQISGATIPAYCFGFSSSLPATSFDPEAISYYIKVAASLNDWQVQDYVSIIEKQFKSATYLPEFHFACRIFSEAMCLFANACDYVSDLSQKVDVERFIDVFCTLAGDCVADYEEIICPDGNKKIKDVQVGDTVLSYDFNKGCHVYKKVVNKWDKGELPVYRVTFRDSTHIDVTENHPMWVRNNEKGKSIYVKKPLSEINHTGRVSWKKKVPTSNRVPYVAKDIEWLTEDHCFLIGHFLAEGSTSSHVETSGREIPDEIIPRLDKLGIPYSLRTNNSNVPIVRFLRSPFKEYIRKLQRSSFDLELPEEMMWLPENKLEAILDGYFLGDGHYHKTAGGTTEKVYSTSCEKFALQLRDISLKLGNSLWVYKQEKHGGVGTKPIYRCHDKPKSESKRRHGYDDLGETSIKSVEPIGTAHVYDIEIEDTHTFVFRNGLLGHNCEDLGRAIYMLCSILRTQKESSYKDPILYWSIKLIKLFVPVMITGVATAPSLGGNGENDDICHIYAALLPRMWFAECLSDRRMADTVYDGLQRQMPINQWEHVREAGGEITGVPVQILEGTNYSNPLPAPLSLYMASPQDINTLVEDVNRMKLTETQHPALARFGIQAQNPNVTAKGAYTIQENGFSSFYRRPVGLWSDVPLSFGGNAVDFSIGYGDQSKEGYAVDMRDFVCMSKRISLLSVTTFDREDIDHMMNVLQQERPTLLPTAPNASTPVPKSEMLTRLDSLCDRYNQIPPKRTRMVAPFHSYRLNHLNKLTAEMIAALETVLQQGYYKAIQYYLHPLSRDGELYFIDVRLYSQ
jgi:intein/homing endonuclease